MDLTKIGSVELRMVAQRLRKVGKLAGHTPESVACVAKAASCVNDRAIVGGRVSGRQVAVMDSAAYVALIEKAIGAGDVSRETVEGIAKWAIGKRGGTVQSSATEQAATPEVTPADDEPEEAQDVEIESEETEETAVPEKRTPRPPIPGSIDALIDARIDTRMDGFKPVSSLSKEDVRQIVNEIARETAQTITIKIERTDGSKVETTGEHFMFDRLVRLMGAGIHVYLWGPAGTGKTTAALRAATAIGKPSEIDTLDPSTPKSGILGYRTPTGEPAETAFTRMYRAGGVYIPDECDNGPAHVQSLLNSALANGHAPCAWGQVARGDGFVLTGTGNTPGRPTPSFPDRRPMSAAFADRLYFLYWPLDPGIECRAAGLPVPRYPTRKQATCSASEWVIWVRAIREWAERNAPTLMITPRASLLGMQALAVGETPEEVANGLVFRGADKTLIEKALNAVSLPG